MTQPLQPDASAPRRNVLALAYIFPPFFSVGGSIRVVKFLKYLPALGWKPFVVTVDDSREYKRLRRGGSEELLADLPPEVVLCRTTAGEPSAALLERGRQARERSRLAKIVVNTLKTLRDWGTKWVLIPDENITWMPFAIRQGRRVVREAGIDVLFVTCPPHSAAVIGALLKLLTRKPLVLDFRDDWVGTHWQQTRPALVRAINRLLEWWSVRTADRVVLVTPLSREMFVRRYPRQRAEKFVYIPNGTDLADYPFAEAPAPAPATDGPFTIVHAGLLSVAEDWPRSPEAVFRAIAHLRETQPEVGGHIRLLFTGELPDEYRAQARALGLQDAVQEVGYLPRPEFAALLQSADLLLTINYHGFPTLIPGKIYEYWAVGGPPILLLSSPGAATQLIDTYRLGVSVETDDSQGVEAALLDLYRRRQAGTPLRLTRAGIEDFAREKLAARLAQTLEEAIRS